MSEWTEIKLLDHFQQHLAERLKAIRGARRRIIFEPHQFNTDNLGILLLSEILKSKERNPSLTAEIIFDYWGAHHVTPELAVLLQEKGLRIRYFNYPALQHFQKLNTRSHRKILIVDDVVFLGGVNSCEEYFGMNTHENLLDREVLLSGDLTELALQAVRSLWNSKWSSDPEEILNWKVSYMPWSWQFLDSTNSRKRKAKSLMEKIESLPQLEIPKAPPAQAFRVKRDNVEVIFDEIPLLERYRDRVRSSRRFLHLLRETRRRLVWESLFFLVPKPAQRILDHKLRNGVKATVLTNGYDSICRGSFGVLTFTLVYFKKYLKNGIQLFGIKGRSFRNQDPALGPKGSYLSTHAKSYVFDDDTYLGSFNLDHRSFYTNLETAVIVRHEAEFADAVAKSILSRIELHALPMDPWGTFDHPVHGRRVPSPFEKIFNRLVVLFRSFIEPFY